MDIGFHPQIPADSGSPLADVVATILGARVVVSQWPVLGELPPWQVACAETAGRPLAPR